MINIEGSDLKLSEDAIIARVHPVKSSHKVDATKAKEDRRFESTHAPRYANKTKTHLDLYRSGADHNSKHLNSQEAISKDSLC